MLIWTLGPLALIHIIGTFLFLNMCLHNPIYINDFSSKDTRLHRTHLF